MLWPKNSQIDKIESRILNVGNKVMNVADYKHYITMHNNCIC